MSGDILLVDHDEYRWIFTANLVEYEFAPADIKLFVEILASVSR